MKIFSVLRKSIREQKRSLSLFIMTIIAAPFFVLLYYMMLGGGSTSYNVLILNQDRGIAGFKNIKTSYGDSLINGIKNIAYTDNKSILNVTLLKDLKTGEMKIKNREAAALIIIPENFSARIFETITAKNNTETPITIIGDLSNPYYGVAAILVTAAVLDYAKKITGLTLPITITEEALGASASRTEFENYVPGLLIMAIVMLIFFTAMPIAQEIESGTIRRLQITKMTSFDYLAGISILQIFVGIISVVLTFLTADMLGFHSQGSIWLAIMIGVITGLSFVGVGLIVACFSKNSAAASIIGTFPMFILMFFSGAAFPLPKLEIFTIGNKVIGIQDFLAPTHAVVALNKILTMGEKIDAIFFELSAMTILSVLYFTFGIWLFKRKHLTAK